MLTLPLLTCLYSGNPWPPSHAMDTPSPALRASRRPQAVRLHGAITDVVLLPDLLDTWPTHQKMARSLPLHSMLLRALPPSTSSSSPSTPGSAARDTG